MTRLGTRAAFIRISCIFIVLCCLGACQKSPQFSALPHDAVIVAFGDSLTEGVGVEPEHSYPARLEHLVAMHVISAGVSGETTTEGLRRLPDVLRQTQPDLVILLEGGNDILRNTSPAKIEQNLRQMVREIRSFGAQVLLVGVPEKKLFSDSAPFYEQIADEFEIVFDGTSISELLRDPNMKSDPIHLNEKGYAKLAEYIHGLLEEKGAL